MSDKGKRVNASGHQAEATVKRARPFGKDDAPVILLDEATASLDPENETLIQRAVGALCAGKTVIVIAHRLRTIANADKIVVLDDGNIVEEGTHDDLVSSNGLYRHLWDLQLRSSSWGANGRMAAEGAQ